MSKFQNIRFTKDALLVILCVLGTAAVAWWAWAAGPVETHSALGSSPRTETTQGISSSPYGSVSPIGSGVGSGGAGQSGGAASSSGNISSPVTPPVNVSPEPDPLYPIDPTPNCPINKYPGNIQPMIYCPVCQTYQTSDGIRYPCGCGGTEMLCASPL